MKNKETVSTLQESVERNEESVEETVVENEETVVKGEETEEIAISPRTGKPIEKKYAPKKRGRGGHTNYDNNWLKPENQLKGLEEGDNTKFLMVQIELMNMPNIDMTSTEEVGQRLSDYFALYAKADMKPTVAGMAIALNGMSRQTLWAITHDAPVNSEGYRSSLPRDVADLIKKAYHLLENLWESYMNSGKINPVSGIFLGKNNYGYQDKTEYVVTPNQKNDSDYSAEEIRQRYIPSDSQKRLSTSDSETNDY